MTFGEGRFAGGRLYYRWWRPDGDAKAHVVLAHGYAEHSGRYGHVAAALTDHGFTVWALDHRGHGQSEGERANIESVETAVADLDEFVDTVRDEVPDGPLFLAGHSMGGLIATAYAQDHQDRLAGLALSGPLLHVAPELVALADLDEIPDLGSGRRGVDRPGRGPGLQGGPPRLSGPAAPGVLCGRPVRSTRFGPASAN